MRESNAWRAIGVASAVLGVVFAILAQAVAGDFLPPEISVSQYGVGPNGWIFSCWMIAIAVSSGSLYRALPIRPRITGWWLAGGMVGTTVMALVRTDPGGLQHSINAKIHMVGSIFALVALPIGVTLGVRSLSRLWGRISTVLAVLSAGSLVLLLLAAFGMDTAGLGPARSWAFWQAIAVLLEMVLLLIFAGTVGFGARRGAVVRELPAGRSEAR